MTKKQFTIDGANFKKVKTFYDEIERVLCPNLDFKWGRNLDGFDDILRGGFGVFEPDEPIDLIWKNAEKSQRDLGRTFFDTLIEIIKDNSHINLIIK